MIVFVAVVVVEIIVIVVMKFWCRYLGGQHMILMEKTEAVALFIRNRFHSESSVFGETVVMT